VVDSSTSRLFYFAASWKPYAKKFIITDVVEGQGSPSLYSGSNDDVKGPFKEKAKEL